MQMRSFRIVGQTICVDRLRAMFANRIGDSPNSFVILMSNREIQEVPVKCDQEVDVSKQALIVRKLTRKQRRHVILERGGEQLTRLKMIVAQNKQDNAVSSPTSVTGKDLSKKKGSSTTNDDSIAPSRPNNVYSALWFEGIISSSEEDEHHSSSDDDGPTQFGNDQNRQPQKGGYASLLVTTQTLLGTDLSSRISSPRKQQKEQKEQKE
eukprot:CAMPEP_0201553854 /NCGR_PEP_ID=MMETSP0173_2-20130828/34681_1 /ASSEMBLY_ACC=CAM_ASM_000268 /TAXON_ID=218659 /ORGANISM="Vexillifera sp., Strain DIVA3 564/2" /LENGTH=208 /DNA_ID=CAMNT_0047964879 /DNA_START=249 /DNA_END=872 /DNA_ORIENTATION=+